MDLLESLLAEARRTTDPVERAKRLTTLIDELGVTTNEASRERLAAMAEAVARGRSQAELAEALSLTRSRVNQMLKTLPHPIADRAILAADAKAPVTIAVVEKRDAETGQPVITTLTREAAAKLEALAESFDLEHEIERVPPPGIVDLNTDNLVVLIGPRISALVAQVVASDPAIQWRRDKRGRWYLVEVATGREFHSDFDDGWDPASDGERTCIAQIGRIRRPDGNGSFLYLGGAHAPGTAGAVDLFVRDVGEIWEQTKRALWSAVVTTKVAEDGEIISSDLATPIYTQGKR